MKQGIEQGMMTFDESLYRLYAGGKISYEEAIEHADSKTDLALRVRLQGPAPPDSAHHALEGAWVDGQDADGTRSG